MTITPEVPIADVNGEANRATPITAISYGGGVQSTALVVLAATVPPKSACFFCPFKKPSTWAEQRRDEPEHFWKSVELERTLNRRRDMLGKDHVFLTRFNRPLDEAITEAQTPLFATEGPESCDSGYCWT